MLLQKFSTPSCLAATMSGLQFETTRLPTRSSSRTRNTLTSFPSPSSRISKSRVDTTKLSKESMGYSTCIIKPGKPHVDISQVIHTASPFILQVEDPERDLLKPAKTGTVEVLASIQKNAPNVKRVVITSSFASIIDIPKGTRPGYVYSEKDWNPTTWEEAAKKETPGEVSYCASKSFAEKAAFEFVEQNKPNFNIATICPPMVYGPSGSVVSSLDRLNTSAADIYRLMNGTTKEIPETSFYGFAE